MAILGLVFAVVVDLLLPLGLLLWMAIENYRHRRSHRRETWFWVVVGVYTVWLWLFVVRAVADTFAYEGSTVYLAVFFSLPLSLLPSALNSTFIHYFFTTQEWADFGYLIVLPVFLVGLVAWALMLPVGIRRLVQAESRRAALRGAS